MKRATIPILLWLSALNAGAQEFYLSGNAEITLTDGAELVLGTDLANDGRLDIQTGATLVSRGSIENSGFLINSGEISLYQNWTNTGTFNTSAGSLNFVGAADQLFTTTYLPVSGLVINKTGQLKMAADSIKISESLLFANGVLQLESGTKLIVENSADVEQTSGSASYLDGTLISRGSGYRLFPVGQGGYYGTLSFLEMQSTGKSTEVEVSLLHAPDAGTPGDDLIGVSDENRWKVQVNKGYIEDVLIEIDFEAENIDSFTKTNNIRRKYETPVLALASELTGPYSSLGVESLYDTDSATFGIIASQDYFEAKAGESRYLAVALAPTKDPKGEVYFPNVFSPKASDPDNQAYKVFGELIANTPFQIKIYNRFNTLVYQANSFDEANLVGWNGTNSTGKEEETGIYYVFVKYAFEYDPTTIHSYSGSLFLKR